MLHRIACLFLLITLASGCLFAETPAGSTPDMAVEADMGPSDMSVSPDGSVTVDASPPPDASGCLDPCELGATRCADDGSGIESCVEVEGCPVFGRSQTCEENACTDVEGEALCGCPEPCTPEEFVPGCTDAGEAISCEFIDDLQCNNLVYETCESGTCEEGSCKDEPACPGACDMPGAPPMCDGNEVRTCRFDPVLGCDRFFFEDCKERVCIRGMCEAPSECRPGQPPTCSEDDPDSIVTCEMGANGPTFQVSKCGDFKTCRDDECVCDNECEPGEARCSGRNSYLVCEQTMNGCYAFTSGSCNFFGTGTVGCNGGERVSCGTLSGCMEGGMCR